MEASCAGPQKGHQVDIFEKLPYPGGRFTNLEYQGYQLTTGALHMIPHAENGPLGTMLKELGTGVRIIPSHPPGLFRIGGRDYEFRQLKDLFSLRDKVKVASIHAMLKLGKGGKESYRDWVKKRLNNRLALELSDSFCGWTLSIHADKLSSREFLAITSNFNRYRGPGIPEGGCGAVTRALVKVIEEGGGNIHLESKVTGIQLDGGRVTGMDCGGESHEFDVVVSNIGPKATVELCGEEAFSPDYVKSVSNIPEAAGIKISVACDRPMLGHTGALFTPQAKRIDGLNEVTNADPSLAPEGKHLLMSHQTYEPGRDIREEIELGLQDLRELFPDFDRHCRVLMVQSYHNGWPVNRTMSGKLMGPETPVRGLYNVGDAIKPRGWVETEGVAAGVKAALERIDAYGG
ncbi:MAG: NAD(P)/FAD-dependent oxidoreductase [Euryarchaeota archaeon]|nr:NAD(P)/FAD-dependent oxidoreductase [Euryarchaeota archaeon]